MPRSGSAKHSGIGGLPAWRGTRSSRKSVGWRSAIAPDMLGLDDEQPPVERLPAAVLDRRSEDIETRGRLPLEVVEDRPAPQVDPRRGRATSSRTASNSGWPGVTHSSVGSVGRSALSNTTLPVLAAKPPEAGFQPLADRQQGARHLARRGRRGPSFATGFGWTPAIGAASTKKSSITSGTSRRSLASTDLPTIAERFSSLFASPSSVDSVIARNRSGHVADDPVLDARARRCGGRTCRGTASPAGSTGKTSPTTSKTWSVPSSLRISRSRSSSFCEHPAFAGVHARRS